MAKAAPKKSKGASRNAPPPKKGAPGWLWLLTGFVVVAFVFFLAHLWQGGGKGKIEAMLPGTPAASTADSGATDSGTADGKTAQDGQSAATSGSAPQHFDFYTLLPNQRVIPSKASVDAGNKAAATVASSIKQPAEPNTASTQPATPLPVEPATIEARPAKVSYFLQAGSFHNEAEADRRRASIILLGLPVKTERFSKDNQNWFRVVVGPLTNKEGQQSARASLKGSGIDSVPLKQG